MSKNSLTGPEHCRILFYIYQACLHKDIGVSDCVGEVMEKLIIY